jgi:hypothetical protein
VLFRSANALSLNSGTIRDASGNSATLTHAQVADNNSYLVDTTAPTSNTLSITNIVDNVGTTANIATNGLSNDSTPTLQGNFGGATAAASLSAGDFIAIYRSPDMTGVVSITPNSMGSNTQQIPSNDIKTRYSVYNDNFPSGGNPAPVYLPSSPVVGQLVEIYREANWGIDVYSGSTRLYTLGYGESVFFQWDGSSWVDPLVYAGQATLTTAASDGQSTWQFNDTISSSSATSQYFRYMARLEDTAGNRSTTSSAYGLVLDTTAPNLGGYDTRVGGGGGYWFTEGGGYTSGFMPTVMGGTRLGFAVYTDPDVVSIDYSVGGGNYGTVTNDGVNGFDYGNYWVFYITMPNISLSSGMVNFVFKDAAGNGVNAYNTGGTNSVFDITINSSPLVLDLDSNGVRTTAVQRGVLFDVLAAGSPVRSGWTDGIDGLLVLDLNGDSQISDGRELFGNGTDTPNGKAADGFAALAQYDLNQDAVIDSQDAVFSSLQVWVDANIDGLTEPSELKSLADLGIASLGLQAQVGTQIDNGNLLGLNASWTGSDGAVHDLVDVFFGATSLQGWVEQATQRLDLAADAQANAVSVHRADVLAAEQSTLVVKTGANDVVRLEESGWVATGSEVSVDDHSYGLWSNAGAHLWIDRNATVQPVL